MTTTAIVNRSALAEGALDLREELTFESVYGEHFAFVWRSIRGLGVAASSVDDAAQDCFIIAHRKLGECHGPTAVRAWLYGIARRVASDYRRSGRRRGQQQPLDLAPSQASSDDTEGEFSTRETLQEVEEYLHQLEEKDLALFVLATIHQLPIREVGEMIGLNINTAYSRLKVVRGGLLEHLRQKDGGEGR